MLTNRQNTKIMFFEKNKKRSVDIETCSGTLILKNPKIHKNNKKTVFLMRSVGVKTIFLFYKNNKFRTTQHCKHTFFTRKKCKNIDSCLLSRTKNTEISLFQSDFLEILPLLSKVQTRFLSSCCKCMWQCSS